MNIHTVVAMLDESSTISSVVFPCSSRQRAEEIEKECEEIYGQTMVASAIVESQIDAGFNKPLPIH